MPGLSIQPVNDDGGRALSAGTDWHLCLGHPSLTKMNAMFGKGLIPSLATSKIAAVKNCEVCCQVKMSQSRHKHVSEFTKACHKMGRTHQDLVGLMAVASHHGGYLYFSSGMEIGCRLSLFNLLH